MRDTASMRDTAAMLLFPEDFAQARQQPPQQPEPPPPGFTPEDVAVARDAGFAAGERAGRDAAAAELRVRTAETLAVIATRLDGVHEAATEAAEASAAALAQLLLDALGAAFPTLRARHGEAELRRVIAAIAPALTREKQVVLRVHPSLAGAAAEVLATLPPHTGAPPRIEACERIALGDAVVLWDGGSAVRDSAAAWREVAEALRPLGLLHEAPTTSPATE